MAYESVRDLGFGRPPEHRVPGIILACVSLVVMPLLSRATRKVGRALGSSAMQADAKQTEFCTYLSAILLVGLLLNTFFGLWLFFSMTRLPLRSTLFPYTTLFR